MQLAFTEAEANFRQEVLAFLLEKLPQAIHEKMVHHRPLTKEEVVSWQQTLNARGWATPSWPSAWGGPGWSAVQRYIFYNELHQHPAPEPLSFNVSMIGPAVGQFGTQAQKDRFLARIANIDDWWCQGFSEPGAGSDLASLSTSAVRDGEEYVVNGTKMWQGMGHRADWMFALVRTDPHAKKQGGISFLLIDMRSPGITVQPIITIDRHHDVNTVFLENVRVPVACRLHDENKGWDVAKFLLGNERSGIARIGMSRFLLKRAKELAQRTPIGNETMANDPWFRRRVADIETDLKMLEITQLRVLSMTDAHSKKPDPRTSLLKIKGVELRQAASELLLKVAGPQAITVDPAYGSASQGEDIASDPHWSSTIAPLYFILRAASIYGGTTEVQKNILARTVLSLPQ